MDELRVRKVCKQLFTGCCTEQILGAKSRSGIELTYSDDGNLAKDMKNSTKSGDSSMDVACAGAVTHDKSNATSFTTIGHTEVEELQ